MTENGLETGLLEPDDLKALMNEEVSFAVIMRGRLVEVLGFRKRIKEMGMCPVYQKISPQRLFITDWPPEEDEAEV